MNARLVAPLAAALALACQGPARPKTAPAPQGGGGTAAGSASVTTPAQTPVGVSEAEVVRRAIEVFGEPVAVAPDSTAPESTGLGADTLEAADAAPTWDIDVHSYETHARVEHYVNAFTSPGARERTAQRLERGTRYDAMIRAKFRAAGLPEDMTYLALIESGYNPHAYSRAAAVGMWQFMASTARGMGLRVDWWVDERRDPVRSTDGAIKFLGLLREQMGSLYLAAAAYNGGPGRVSRGLTRFADDLEGTTGDAMFFALAEKNYLPSETKNYVPQLIAAALIGKEPEKYGLTVDPQPPFEYDSVRVGPSTPLVAVAHASGASTSEITDLNAFLLRGVTPPGKPMYVRVPVGRADGFDSAFAALPKAERSAYTTVVSKKRQSLGAIAAAHDLTARQLGWYNPNARKLKSGNLHPGQTILVPSRAVVSMALDVPNPAVERYGGSKGVKVHVVRRGDNLSRIAKRYGTTVRQLKALNGLRKDSVFPGQALVVKGSARRASTTKAATKGKRSARRNTPG